MVVVAPYVALLVPECHAEPIVLNDESPTGYSFVDDQRFYDPTGNLSAAQVTCPPTSAPGLTSSHSPYFCASKRKASAAIKSFKG